MLISEVCLSIGLTKKAVEYYAEQGLISPCVLENGYRDYAVADVERLKRIGILRKLGLNVGEIKRVLGADAGSALQQISTRQVLLSSREQKKAELLTKLMRAQQYDAVLPDLKSLEERATITQRLLDAFPGFFGCYLGLHFARFLDIRAVTEDQESAYQEIVAFLDDVPPFAFSKDVQELLEQSIGGLSGQEIGDLAQGTAQATEDFEVYYLEHKDAMEGYMRFKRSAAYQQSGVPQMEAAWRAFLCASGYYTVFLPAMKRLSPVYADYVKKLEAANEKMLMLYPELAGPDMPHK